MRVDKINAPGSKGKEFLFEVFPCPQKDGVIGEWRPTLGLRELNKFICSLKFRVITLVSVFPSLDLGDWFMAFDFYFHINVHPRHRRLLRFAAGQQHYQYSGLPFRLSVALRVFTTARPVVAAHYPQ